MAYLSAFSLIRILSLFHITVAYFLLAAPHHLVSQHLVILLGEAMRLPAATSFDQPTALSAFAACILAFLGLSDLTAASMMDQVAHHYWGSQTPVRLLFLFGLTFYSYLFKPSNSFGTNTFGHSLPGDMLKNDLIFTWSFMEMGMWFLIYLSLREERRRFASHRT